MVVLRDLRPAWVERTEQRGWSSVLGTVPWGSKIKLAQNLCLSPERDRFWKASILRWEVGRKGNFMCCQVCQGCYQVNITFRSQQSLQHLVLQVPSKILLLLQLQHLECSHKNGHRAETTIPVYWPLSHCCTKLCRAAPRSLKAFQGSGWCCQSRSAQYLS